MKNVVNLGDVAEVKAGNSAPQDKALFINGRHPFVRTSDVGLIKTGKLVSSRDLLNDNGVEKLNLFPKGTILFPKSGASTLLNHRVILEIDAYVSSHLATIKANEHFLLDKYIFYFLQTVDAADLVADSAYPSLQAKTIKEIKIPLPPLIEQKRIVAKLDAAYAEIDKAISMSEQKAIKASDYGYLIIKSTIKELINKYGKCSISDIAIIQPHKKISLKRLNENDEVSFMGMNSLGIEKKYSEPEFNKTLKEAYKAYQYFENGDVIFAKITPCFENGKLSIAKNLTNGVGFGSSEFVVLRTNANFNSEFLYYCLLNKTFRKNGEKNMSGAVGHKRVSKEYFHNYTIPLPPLDVQQLEIKKFDEVWENTKNIISTQNKKVKELIKLKSAILSQELKFEAA